MNIMVTGAAGEYGAYALEYLKKYAPDDTIIAQVRDKKKAKALEAQGYEVTRLQPDKTGHISMDDVRAALRPDTVLVSMMLVNNELGVVLPVAETAKAIKAAGCPALLHCDAVQGFLKVSFAQAVTYLLRIGNERMMC